MSPAREPRGPEPLDLPEDLSAAPAGGGQVGLPYFVTLQQQAEQNRQALVNQRRADRIDHIRRLQNLRDSKVVVYYSEGTLEHFHSINLYELLRATGTHKRLDLFLRSPGGYADAAFKMAGLCRDFATEHLGILIPQEAKSAATLWALGADELVMGDPSELGPVDPRIDVRDNYGRLVQVSATSVKDALELLETLVGDSAEKSLKYMPLIEKLNLDVLGEYKRALESSKQYAAELLENGKLLKKNTKKAAEDLAANLAEGYYSHGYPIGPLTARDKLNLNVTYCRDDPVHEPLWTTMWHLHNLLSVTLRESPGVGAIFETEEMFLISMEADA